MPEYKKIILFLIASLLANAVVGAPAHYALAIRDEEIEEFNPFAFFRKASKAASAVSKVASSVNKVSAVANKISTGSRVSQWGSRLSQIAQKAAPIVEKIAQTAAPIALQLAESEAEGGPAALLASAVGIAAGSIPHPGQNQAGISETGAVPEAPPAPAPADVPPVPMEGDGGSSPQ